MIGVLPQTTFKNINRPLSQPRKTPFSQGLNCHRSPKTQYRDTLIQPKKNQNQIVLMEFYIMRKVYVIDT